LIDNPDHRLYLRRGDIVKILNYMLIYNNYKFVDDMIPDEFIMFKEFPLYYWMSTTNIYYIYIDIYKSLGIQ